MNNQILSLSRRNMMLGSFGVLAARAVPAYAGSSVASIKSTINTTEKSPAISPFMYGGFIEHIGNLINHSLWSEMFVETGVRMETGVRVEWQLLKPETPVNIRVSVL